MKSIKKARKNKTRDFTFFSLPPPPHCVSMSHFATFLSCKVEQTTTIHSIPSLTHRERCNQHIYKSEICLATLCDVEMKNVISLELMAGFSKDLIYILVNGETNKKMTKWLTLNLYQIIFFALNLTSKLREFWLFFHLSKMLIKIFINIHKKRFPLAKEN